MRSAVSNIEFELIADHPSGNAVWPFVNRGGGRWEVRTGDGDLVITFSEVITEAMERNVRRAENKKRLE